MKYRETEGSIGDYDSDTMLITNNKLLIEAAEKNYAKFAVPTSLVTAMKRKRYFNNEDKCDLDIRTSVNKIGEIVNLSQELNTLFWDNLHKGQTFDENQELYNDIVKLAILSNVEINYWSRHTEMCA